MATVYLAYDPRFKRQVAIKVLPRQFTHDPKYLARFEQEAQMIAGLEHPAIVPVYDFGEQEDAPFLVMRYMPGGSLRERLRGKPLSLEETLAILEQLAPAIDYAHELGIVHRDLKPENVFFDPDGRPYMADFGIARLAEDSKTLTVVGTPAYMSPEQVEGDEMPDGRADIYALGVMLYEMLTGKAPYQAETPTKQMLAHILKPVPTIKEDNAELPGATQEVIDKVMAKKRDERYGTAAELVAALEALIAPELMAEATEEAAGGDAAVDGAPAGMPAEEEAVSVAMETPDEAGKEDEAPPSTPVEASPEADIPAVPAKKVEQEAVVGADESGGLPRWVWWAAGAVALALVALLGIWAVSYRLGLDDTPHTPVQDQETAQIPEGAYLERALAGEFAGRTVTILGPLTDEEQAIFEESIVDFSHESGISIEYTGSREVESVLDAMYQGESPPDIVNFAQPGLMQDYAAMGAIFDVRSFLTEDQLAEKYDQSWLDMARVEGPDGGPITAGVWHRYNSKSYVWYPIRAFEEQGYPIPGNWDELLNLANRMVEEGEVPWCIGIESADATGWVATDWTEEMMLRTASLEDYDAWVRGDLPFDSPQVRDAILIWSDMWFNPDYVLGGRDGILTTSFMDAAWPMFEDPPHCWMHRNGNFMTAFFPNEAVYGRDYGVFYFPPVDEALGRPMLIAGDMMSMFNDREEVRAVMEYFTTPESVLAWTERGAAFSPHAGADLSMYAEGLPRDLAAINEQATSYRFDASDIMPAPVGTETFWRMMTEYIAGNVDLETALRDIDASWPR